LGPWGGRQLSSLESGKAGGGTSRERCGIWSRGPKDSICGLDWGREPLGGRGWQSKAKGAAGARAPARGHNGAR
jgi:hypothetical protein